MDDSVTPLLGMGIMAVAAISLLNAAGTGVHALEPDKTGKRVFVFRSDRAQDLRRSFRLFPQIIARTYYVFVSAIIALRFSPEAYVDPVFRNVFMQSAIVCYALMIVARMAGLSRKVFLVIQDPARTSGS